MDFKKILGDRTSYKVPVENMVSLLDNEIRYKDGACPVNEEIYINAINSCIFKDTHREIIIKESGIYFDIGILNISLGSKDSIINTINGLIDFYNRTIKSRKNKRYIEYVNYRISVIKEVKSKIELMYSNNNRIEKIDESKIDEKKLKLYVAYQDMEDAKNSDFNSSKFLKSIMYLKSFIDNNPELIQSKAYFYYYDFKKEQMVNCKTTDMVSYVEECVKRNNNQDFNEEDIINKNNLYEAYLVMEDLKTLDESADYYQDYINILTDYIKNNLNLLMQDYSYKIINRETGVSTEYKISDILIFVQKLNNKTNKKLIYKE